MSINVTDICFCFCTKNSTKNSSTSGDFELWKIVSKIVHCLAVDTNGKNRQALVWYWLQANSHCVHDAIHHLLSCDMARLT